LTELDDEQQAELSAFTVDFADGVSERADFRCGDGLRYLAFRAASARREVLFRGITRDTKLLIRDELDELDAFWDFVAKIRDGSADRELRRAAIGRLGRVREQPWLIERGYTDDEVRRYETNAYRFLNDLRVSERSPDVYRTLPAFAPVVPWYQRPWVQAAGVVVVAAAIVVALLFGRETNSADRPRRAGAVVALSGQLPAGPHVILGWGDGRWTIVTPDGHDMYESSATTRVPGRIEGGAIGDLNGDGRAEIVLYTAPALEGAPHLASGIWVFTDAGGTWQTLAVAPTHLGDADPDRCARARQAQLDGAAETLSPDDRLALRRGCRSRVSGVSVEGGALFVHQGHYGRQLLRVSCDAAGCSAPTLVGAIDADIDDVIVGRAPGHPPLTVATGCWKEDGPHAYGLAAVAAGGVTAFEPFAGRTFAAELDRERLVVVVGVECEDRLSEQHAVAGQGAATPPRGAVLVVDRAPERWSAPLQMAAIDGCCQSARVWALRDGDGEPQWIVVAFVAVGGRADDWRLIAFDARRALADQRPVVHELGPLSMTFTGAVVDAGGTEQLVIAAEGLGATLVRVDDDGVHLDAW
jgi:hypothetical protein